MRYSKPVSILGLILTIPLLAGCEALEEAGQGRDFPTAAELEQYNAAVEPEDRIICRDEKPTGSRISHTTCRRAGEIQATSDLTQEEFRRVIR